MTMIVQADAPGTYGDSGAMVYATFGTGLESIEEALAAWSPGTVYYYVAHARAGDRIPRHAVPSQHSSRAELRERLDQLRAERDTTLSANLRAVSRRR